MIHAYDKTYLERARVSLGVMLDFAVNELQFQLSAFWKLFLQSDICPKFEHGDFSVLTGMSGIEITYSIVGDDYRKKHSNNTLSRSKEYWLGWALAYYQWYTDLSFFEITEFVSIEEIRELYSPYHEMDIHQFCDKMNELYVKRNTTTKLKKLRLAAGMSQSELAEYAEVPLRTIQQYEQRQKNLNKAQAETVLKLANALFCRPVDLLEKVII